MREMCVSEINKVNSKVLSQSEERKQQVIEQQLNYNHKFVVKAIIEAINVIIQSDPE